MSRARREAHGRRAETFAVLWLRLKGWRILARRYRTPVGEIDIVARRRGMLAFVEVKARGSAELGMEALAPAQARRVRRAAEAWIAGHPGHDRLTLRFDLIVVAPWRLPLHLPNLQD